MRRKPTAARKWARRDRRGKTEIIFINGKQKRVQLEPLIDGLAVEEFIERNADSIWLHQNEIWELMPIDNDRLPTSAGDAANGPFSDLERRSDEMPF